MRTAIAVAAVAAFTGYAIAQIKPQPPPAWHQGKSDQHKESKLAPHAGKLTETLSSRGSSQ